MSAIEAALQVAMPVLHVEGSEMFPKLLPYKLSAQNAARLMISPVEGSGSGKVVVVYSPMINVFVVPSLICFIFTGPCDKSAIGAAELGMTCGRAPLSSSRNSPAAG